jgi:hypothetical protein
MSEWQGYLLGVSSTLWSVLERVPIWIWFGVIALFVVARVGRAISREVAHLRENVEGVEVQLGETQEHLRQIARTLRLWPEHSTVTRDN